MNEAKREGSSTRPQAGLQAREGFSARELLGQNDCGLRVPAPKPYSLDRHSGKQVTRS